MTKYKEIEKLNHKIDELLDDLIEIKNSNVTLQDNIDTSKIQQETLEENLNAQVMLYKTLQEVNTSLEMDLNIKNEELQTLVQKNKKWEQSHQERCDELQILHTQMDELIDDLANIRKSKCWIYTKYIRTLQAVFKGNK